ncbi:MAG: DUF3450 family protein [Campylobacterota bacterium]|nr:DUF3450 family protein [Campylobacterota bacterium]
MPIKIPALAGLITAALLMPQLSLAQTDNSMVESLMKLRGEVESLHSQVLDDQDAFQSSMKSLALQKNDFEAQINRQETQLKKIDQEITQIRDLIKKRSSKTDGLNPMIIKAIDDLQLVVSEGIPFKVALRENDIKEIKTQLEGNLITPEQALSKIWGSYDDALRMSSENGLFKQPIMLGGEEKLAEVVKLGTLMLFFKLPTGEVGYAKKEAGKFHYIQESDELKQKQILVLFDAMKKQIRTGYFSIPYAVVTQGGAK